MASARAPLARRTGAAVWVIRAVTAAMFVVAVVVAVRRFSPNEEQAALRRYVETEVPALLEKERGVQERLDRLADKPGPSPAEARTLFVDDIIPRLIALRAQAAAVEARTPALVRAKDEYLAYLDLLLDACRLSVRAIDAPKQDPDAARAIQQKFLAAGAASKTWMDHLDEACRKAGFGAPPKR